MEARAQGGTQPQGATKGPPKMDSVDTRRFNMAFVAAQIIGLLAVILMTVWTSKYGNGFGWRSDPVHQFNWHPLLMTVGLIYLYANSIMIYRALRNMRKQKLKVIHAAIHTVVCLCVIFALVAVFDSHNLNPTGAIPNMYSLHSWVGLSAVILYFAQWAVSLVAFLYPGLSLNLRAMIMPWHVFLGLFAFILTVGAALMGLTEMAIFKISNYGEFPGSGVLVNIIGLLFVIFGTLVVYIVTEGKYKRHPRPEDGALLQTSTSHE